MNTDTTIDITGDTKSPQSLHPLLLPEILLLVAPLLSQTSIYHCVLVCRTWNACLTPFLFQRVTLPSPRRFDKRASRPMIPAMRRYGGQIQTLICGDNNAVLTQITPDCTAVETLVLGKIAADVLPILRGCKDTLRRLEFTPNQTLRPQTLLASAMSSWNARGMPLGVQLTKDILDAITNMSCLEHLILDYLGLKNQDQLVQFFGFCQQLVSLELHNTAVIGASPANLLFKRMESVSFVDCGMNLSDQMMFLVQCPSLKHITWIRVGHMIPIEMLGPLWTMSKRELESLDISNGIMADDNIALTLNKLPCLTSLVARASLVGPHSLSAVDRLKETVEVIDLVDCAQVTPEMVNHILSTCTALRSLSADRLWAMDVIDSQWVCHELQEFCVVILGHSVLPKYETQHAIYTQIAKLRKLRLLNLGRSGATPNWSGKSCLDLGLANGLGQLSALDQLEEFDFCQMRHKLGMGELKFMLKSWPKLEAMHGYLSLDQDRDAFLASFLKNSRPGIKLKHNLRYRRPTTRWEA
ncbi:hypothetical protein BG011_006130 [Mortierella polycephala]|uniref:F-box domain-containing protein n=1 Tax=Mortierella polycephala TaxID=41804 RepID=A0A9P6TZF8_9FUNG|nr:hypothetical protein BG011_006130 [Mortierella polycephala]